MSDTVCPKHGTKLVHVDLGGGHGLLTCPTCEGKGNIDGSTLPWGCPHPGCWGTGHLPDTLTKLNSVNTSSEHIKAINTSDHQGEIEQLLSDLEYKWKIVVDNPDHFITQLRDDVERIVKIARAQGEADGARKVWQEVSDIAYEYRLDPRHALVVMEERWLAQLDNKKGATDDV